MQILEIEQLFQDKETLNQVLEKLQDDIDRVDEYADMVKTNAYNNAEDIKKIMLELSGCFTNLRTVLGIAETQKKNREIRKYNELKCEFEKTPPLDEKGKPQKFVSASTDKEASDYVAEYRRIRNIIQGYKEAVEKDISVLQSVLKDENKEYNHPQGE